MENIKTFILMVGLVLLFMWFGAMIGGASGMRIALILALGMNFFSYFFSDKIVLRQYHAREVTSGADSKLYSIVQRLSDKASLPMPKVYIIDEDAPNAFATGRNHEHAAVAATSGLLNLLDDNEIEGVLAHEMSHIKHYDILTSSIVAVFAGAISMLSNTARYQNMRSSRARQGFPLLAVILMPLAAAVIRFSISRAREYEADAGSAKLTGHPEWLISALSKLEGYSKRYVMKNATNETAHLFIIHPLAAFSGGLNALFSTHPSTQKRIERLRAFKSQF